MDGYVRAVRARTADGSPRSKHRRALRVILVIGGGFAALATVLGMVAAMVALGEGELTDPFSAAGSGGVLPNIQSLSSHGPGSLSGGLTAGKTIHNYAGSGASRPRKIPIKVSGAWGIRWSFSCPAGRQGTFAMVDTSSKTKGIHASGNQGQGLWRGSPDPGYHELLITSSCSWSADVVLPAPVLAPASHSHRPSSGPTHSPSTTPRPPPSHPPTPSPTPSPSPSPSPTPRHTHTPGPRHTHTPPPRHIG